MDNDFSWHFNALANIKAGRKPSDNNPVSEGYPQAGYYWVRQVTLDEKGSKVYGPRIPIAIWQDEEGWTVEPHQFPSGRSFTAEKIWTWAAHHPIDYDLYVKVAEQGQPWPDEVAQKSNTAGMSDSERLKAIYHDLIEQYEEWLAKLPDGKARNQEDADRAVNMANRFAEVSKEADDIRKKEKEPHAKMADAVDVKYMQVVKLSKEMSKKVKQVSDLFLLAEDRRRKALIEDALAKGVIVEVERPKAGSGSRRSSIREEEVFDVTNLQELSAWVAALNPTDLDFLALVHKIGTRHAKLGTKVPGLSPPRVVNRVV